MKKTGMVLMYLAITAAAATAMTAGIVVTAKSREAREADLGIAGGKHEGLLFRRGEIIKKVPESQLLEALREELLRFC